MNFIISWIDKHSKEHHSVLIDHSHQQDYFIVKSIIRSNEYAMITI